MAGWAQQARRRPFSRWGAPSNPDGTPASQASLQAGMSLPPELHLFLPFDCNCEASTLDSAGTILTLQLEQHQMLAMGFDRSSSLETDCVAESCQLMCSWTAHA